MHGFYVLVAQCRQYKIYNGYLMKYLLLVSSFLFSTVLSAQNVDVVSTEATSQNNVQTFTFDYASLQIQGNNLTVSGPEDSFSIDRASSWDISPDGKFLGAIHTGNDLRAILIDGRGQTMKDIKLDYFDPFDETLSIKAFNNGKFITRDNVANFTFFDSRGSIRYNVSNSSGSEHGEVASEIVADPSGNTVLLYNPRINYEQQQGSRARIVKDENNKIELFTSRERTIKHANVTNNGNFITLISEQAGTDDEVLVTDRFGNEIASISSDMELLGVSLTEDAEYLTLYSGNRAQVYRLSDMERLGSTSFRVSVAYATYSADDEQIVALCGNLSNNRINNPEIHVIHLGERSIARTDLASSLSFIDYNQIKMTRTGANRFIITGLNQDLDVRTQF